MINDKMVTVRLTRGDLSRLMLLCTGKKWEILQEVALKENLEVKNMLLSSAAIYNELHDRLQKVRDEFDEKNAGSHFELQKEV